VAHVLPAWDCIAGQMVVSALLAAERHRLRSGQGQLAELSLKDVAAAMMGHLGIVGEVAVNGVDRARAGNALYGAYGQEFTLACGRRVMVIGLTDRQWRGLVKTLGLDQEIAELGHRLALNLSREGDRWAARHEISALFRPWFTARTLAEVAPLFDAAGLTWSVFRSFAQAVTEDPDLSPDNPMYQMLDQPGIGRLPVPGLPVSFGAFGRVAPSPAPVLGQHSEEILSDVLGLGSGQIGRLMDLGVVAGT
jgi:2-methylfumaryl-CoA isomerase